MELYKVNYKTSNDYRFATYHKTYGDAKRKASEYNERYESRGCFAKATRKKVIVEPHHTALHRGYRRVCDDGRETYYEGRFGIGFVREYATSRSNCGNQFHEIEYFIEKTNKQA